MQEEQIELASNEPQAEGRWDSKEHEKFLEGKSPLIQPSWLMERTGK